MNTYFVKDAFMNWLKTNHHRFVNPPCNIKRTEHAITFNLTGITPLLQWKISESEVFFTVQHKIPSENCTFWDGLMEFDVDEEQSKTGEYYCSACDEQYRHYYPTKSALWETHSFEALLNWSNQNLSSDKILALYDYGGMTAANLLSPAEWEAHLQKDNTPAFKVLPICTTAQNSKNEVDQ